MAKVKFIVLLLWLSVILVSLSVFITYDTAFEQEDLKRVSLGLPFPFIEQDQSIYDPATPHKMEFSWSGKIFTTFKIRNFLFSLLSVASILIVISMWKFKGFINRAEFYVERGLIGCIVNILSMIFYIFILEFMKQLNPLMAFGFFCVLLYIAYICFELIIKKVSINKTILGLICALFVQILSFVILAIWQFYFLQRIE